MTKLAEQLKHGADQAWESLAEGWRDLSGRASGALTRFFPTLASTPSTPTGPSTAAARTDAPTGGEFSFGGWAFLASDVFDDDNKVIVRIEAPGMRRDDFSIQVQDDVLTVSGEKRSDLSVARGRYSIVQCAYGSFRRSVALPTPVQADEAKATYSDGVLRIELPKAAQARARRIAVKAG